MNHRILAWFITISKTKRKSSSERNFKCLTPFNQGFCTCNHIVPLHTNCDLCMSALMGNNLMYGFPLATLSLLFFRSIHSEGHTGVNTVPISCGGSLLREWNVLVRALYFSLYWVRHEVIRNNLRGDWLLSTYNGLNPYLLLTCNRPNSQASNLDIFLF